VNALLRALMQYAQRGSRNVGNFYAPRNVGVHHTLYGRGTDAAHFPTWSSRYVRPSTTPTGQLAATAGDQIPGYSYYWDAAGRGGARQASDLARGQTNLQFERTILEPATQGVAKITTSPRFSSISDPNLLGTPARMIYGPNGQRVVGEVVSSAGPLSIQSATQAAALANRQKAIEASKSAAKIGGTATAAAAFPGFWKSVADAFLGDPYSSMGRMEQQRSQGNNRGAIGTYVGTLAQGPTGMALSAGLNPPNNPAVASSRSPGNVSSTPVQNSIPRRAPFAPQKSKGFGDRFTQFL